MGKPLIMGRRTFQSIGKPLDGRDNIVVTRDPCFEHEGVSAVASVAEAVTLARVLAATRGTDEIMVIGGADIYSASLPLADRVYLTRVHAELDGDRSFPALPPGDWDEALREPLPQGPRDDHASTLIVYERRQSLGS